MNKKPVSFWIYLGIVLVVIVLLTALAALPINKTDEAQLAALENLNLASRLSIASQQRIHLGAIGVYLSACLLDIPFGLLTVALGVLVGGLISGSYAYLIPSVIHCLGVFLLVRLRGVDKGHGWKSSLLVALLCVCWTVLVYFVYDLVCLRIGYVLACVDFVSHFGESLLCAGVGLLMIRIKQTRMLEKGKAFVSVATYEQSEPSQSAEPKEESVCD